MLDTRRYFVFAAGVLLVMIAGLLVLGRISDIYERRHDPENAAAIACAYLSPDTAQSGAFDECRERARARAAVRPGEFWPSIVVGSLGLVLVGWSFMLRRGVHSTQ